MLYIILTHISHFIFFFFVNDLLLAAYFIFILDYEMMLDKKHIGTIFLFSSKWVGKQRRQLATSTACLAQKQLTNIQCGGGSRSFAKEMEP